MRNHVSLLYIGFPDVASAVRVLVVGPLATRQVAAIRERSRNGDLVSDQILQLIRFAAQPVGTLRVELTLPDRVVRFGRAARADRSNTFSSRCLRQDVVASDPTGLLKTTGERERRLVARRPRVSGCAGGSGGPRGRTARLCHAPLSRAPQRPGPAT